MASLLARRGLATKTKGGYKPTGPIDAAVFHWLGISAMATSRLVVICLGAGAVMETFMVKVWIGKTNCTHASAHDCPRGPRAVTVLATSARSQFTRQ